jgi:hypothetical protein
MQTKQNNYQTKTKLSPQGPQRSRYSVARVRHRGEKFYSHMYIIYLSKMGR